MMRAMAETYDIESLGAHGDGIAGGDGVFVALTLPGERVTATRRGDRAALEGVLVPSPERVEPGCPHFGICGGCALQHASDVFVARWKADRIRAALAARGLEAPELRAMATSPPASRRRIALSARRTKKGAAIGFHAPRSEDIVPVSACLVAEPALIDAIPALEEIVALGASRKGALRLTLTLAETGIDLAVEDAKPLEGAASATLAPIAQRVGLARIAWNGEALLTRLPPAQTMGRATVVPSPGGFLQPTKAGETALVAAAREALAGAQRIADLYAGCGTFALPLAEDAEVLAADGEGPALEALDRAWRGTEGLKRVATLRRDLSARPLRAEELKGLDGVVIDPPRAGARAQTEEIAKARIQRIAAVSCNPATFARDARILVDAGYRLDWIQPVDQFRWSPHVELAASFSRAP